VATPGSDRARLDRGCKSEPTYSPLFSRREFLVVKVNCPIFEAWIVGNEQAIPTKNQAFSASTVPFTVHSGTVQTIKCPIKETAESFTR